MNQRDYDEAMEAAMHAESVPVHLLYAGIPMPIDPLRDEPIPGSDDLED